MPTVKAPSPLICETIAIGTELLSGGRLDSNSIVLAEELATIGVQVRYKSAVGDVRSDIALILAQAVKRAGIVLMTGGLGPTVDDCTREAVSQATGRRLRRHKAALEGMMARLAQWQRVPTRSQMRQGMLPAGATVVSNSLGSAPGFCLTWRRAFIVCLPGVPEEMKLMMSQEVMPLLRAKLIESGHTPRPILRKEFHTFGLPEAEVDARLKGVIPKDLPVDLGLLASPTGVLVSLTAQFQGKSNRLSVRFQSLVGEVRLRLSAWLFAEDGETMEEVVGDLLRKRGLTVAVAESCTGGLIGHRLTQIPGSSAYVDRGAICYSNRAKSDMVAVPPELIEKYGAVSHEVAAAMAKGIRERAAVSVGISVTGIAGPGGATPTKPVGLVYVGLNDGAGKSTTQEFLFHGNRHMIKQRSAQAALDLLRRWLIGNSRT